MNPRLNAVLAFLVSAWLVNVLLPAPAYSFENSAEGLQAEVELLNTKIAELQMTVSAVMTQLSTLSTAVITLQTHSMTGANGSPSAIASIPTKATDAGSAKEPISGQAMLVTPQKLEESSLGRQMVDYRFLGYLYQSGTQRAFIGQRLSSTTALGVTTTSPTRSGWPIGTA